MNAVRSKIALVLISSVLALSVTHAASATPAVGPNGAVPPEAQVQALSPEAQAVLDRMTDYLDGLRSFSIDSRSTRDEGLPKGCKLQHNERSNLVVWFPDKMRVDVSGDLQQRSYVCDAAMSCM